MQEIHPDCVNLIPGKLNDRKTPIGELNWVFTAITDSIAWNTLPSPLFQRLFRQDLLVASLFRNFLLADRIMRSAGCTPASVPKLPATHNHPLWQSWDLAVETCLNTLIWNGTLNAMNPSETSDMYSLPPILQPAAGENGTSGSGGGGGGQRQGQGQGQQQQQQQQQNQQKQQQQQQQKRQQPKQVAHPMYVSSPFFAEELTAFEVWLEFCSNTNEPLRPPEQLPVVLQVLLSQAHRVRALVLLRRFLEQGDWAVNLALSVGERAAIYTPPYTRHYY